MKLFYSATSPYVRKVMVTALELGLEPRIARLPASASPVVPNAELSAHNPMGKVPALVTDEGEVLFDSPVICEYLDSLAGGGRIFPAAGPARWTALRLQALGDGLLDAALLTRYETFLRPEALRWPEWIAGQLAKVDASVAAIDAVAESLGDRVDIGTITLACALHYLDFRYGDRDWRGKAPRAEAWFTAFMTRPSMTATSPFNV